MAHKLDSEKSSGKRPQPFTAMYGPGLTIGYRAALYAIDLLGLILKPN